MLYIMGQVFSFMNAQWSYLSDFWRIFFTILGNVLYIMGQVFSFINAQWSYLSDFWRIFLPFNDEPPFSFDHFLICSMQEKLRHIFELFFPAYKCVSAWDTDTIGEGGRNTQGEEAFLSFFCYLNWMLLREKKYIWSHLQCY